jgi:hypothetical protein
MRGNHAKQDTKQNMRKVTEKTVRAFADRKPASVANTRTDGSAYFLHGNKIAEWRNGALWITSAGWNTVTTRDRLNGILAQVCPGSRVYQKAHQLHLNDEQWSGEWTTVS